MAATRRHSWPFGSALDGRSTGRVDQNMTSTATNSDDWRLAIRHELEQMEDDLQYTERTHFEMSATYRKRHLILGLGAAISSATAGAAVVTELAAPIAGCAALAATLLSAVLTFMKPERSAEQHLSAGRQLADVRTRLRHVLSVDLPLSTFEPMRERLEELRVQKNSIDQTAPGTDDKHFDRARAKIKKGLYEADVRKQ